MIMPVQKDYCIFYRDIQEQQKDILTIFSIYYLLKREKSYL